jgi:hypothetical protein
LLLSGVQTSHSARQRHRRGLFSGEGVLPVAVRRESSPRAHTHPNESRGHDAAVPKADRESLRAIGRRGQPHVGREARGGLAPRLQTGRGRVRTRRAAAAARPRRSRRRAR